MNNNDILFGDVENLVSTADDLGIGFTSSSFENLVADGSATAIAATQDIGSSLHEEASVQDTTKPYRIVFRGELIHE